MPMPIQIAHTLARQIAKVRKDGDLTYLRPDAKTQVTVRFQALTGNFAFVADGENIRVSASNVGLSLGPVATPYIVVTGAGGDFAESAVYSDNKYSTPQVLPQALSVLTP